MLESPLFLKSVVDEVFNEIEDIYKRALAIDRATKQPKNCNDQICKLHKDYDSALKDYDPNKKPQPRVQIFLDNLDKMCMQ